MLFRYFAVISPWKRILPLIWTNPNFHYSGNFGTIFLKTGFAILKKMMKSFRKTDNRLSDKVTFSFQLRWDKKSSDPNLKTTKKSTLVHLQQKHALLQTICWSITHTYFRYTNFHYAKITHNVHVRSYLEEGQSIQHYSEQCSKTSTNWVK